MFTPRFLLDAGVLAPGFALPFAFAFAAGTPGAIGAARADGGLSGSPNFSEEDAAAAAGCALFAAAGAAGAVAAAAAGLAGLCAADLLSPALALELEPELEAAATFAALGC